MEIRKESHPCHKYFQTTKIHVNDSWRWLCLNCAWLRRLLRVSVACALCRSFGGRNGKDSACAPTVSQWPSGMVVDIEKGPWSCAFTLPVSGCTHQHYSRRKVPQICGRPGKPEQPRAPPVSVEQLVETPSASSTGAAWGQTCIPTSPELHTGHLGRGWKAGRTQSNLAHNYKSIKGLWKSHSDLCTSSASLLWWLRKITLGTQYAHF